MTSTRNLNTIGNYCLEEKSYLKSQNYYEHPKYSSKNSVNFITNLVE